MDEEVFLRFGGAGHDRDRSTRNRSRQANGRWNEKADVEAPHDEKASHDAQEDDEEGRYVIKQNGP
jgi:hypothetical protein